MALSAEHRQRLRQMLADKPADTTAPASACLPVALTSAQQQLLFIEALSADTPIHNMAMSLALDGTVDRDALEVAIDDVLARHTVLATRIENDAQVPKLVEADPVRLDARTSKSMDTDIAAEARSPFDLERGPLARVVLFSNDQNHRRLLLVVHHIIADAWSLAVLRDDLERAYQARSTGQALALPPDSGFVQHLLEQHNWLNDNAAAEARAHVRDQLSSAPRLLTLRTDRPRRADNSQSAGRCREALATGLLTQVQHLARTHNTTPFCILLAAFARTVAEHSRMPDLVLGTPVAGRDQAEQQDSVGFFSNTLPLRLQPTGNTAALISMAGAALSSAITAARLPFADAVAAVNPERNPAYAPLVQTVFAFDPPRFTEATPGSVVEHLERIETGVARFELEWRVQQRSGQLHLAIDYSAALFDPATIEQMMQRYAGVLTDMVHNRLSEMAGATQLPTPASGGIARRFAEVAQRFPERTALVESGAQIRYDELDLASARLAGQLRGLGVGAGDSVAVLLPHGSAAVTAMLAIARVGASYLPLDTTYPVQRLQFMLNDAGAVLTIAEAGITWLPETSVLTPDPAHAPDPEVAEVQAHDCAYVMYTSGSSGQPKGVRIPHAGILRLTVDPEYLPLGPETVLLAAAPMTFDAATFEVWGALLNGGSSVLARASATDLAELRAALADHRVNTAFLTTALFNLVADEDPELLRPLQHLLFGGERASIAHVRKAQAALRDTRLYNVYGPTEVTTFSTLHEIVGAPADPLPIGRPIDATHAFVLDAAGQPVAQGSAGELYLAGDGVTLGYTGDETLTRQRLLNRPDLWPTPLYRTGDEVRTNPEGDLVFLGRLDAQVKVRGHRIEPGEVDGHLTDHPQVRQAATTAANNRLVSFVVAEGEPDLRAWLAERLPDHLIPDVIEWVAQLPLGATGKVDLRALTDRLESGGHPQPPGDEGADWLLTLWRELLEAPALTADDNFFEAGGHSLIAVRLMHRIQARTGHDVPLRWLLEAPTVRGLATRIDNYAVTPWSPLVPIRAEGTRPPLFIVHPIGGNVLGLADFAKHFDADWPVFGIQAYGVEPGQTPHDNLVEMAATYVDAVRAAQPEGPYYLGGLSLGAIVAFEMTVQLEALGERVAYLMIGDAWLRHHTAPVPGDAFSRVRQLPARLHAAWLDAATRRMRRTHKRNFVDDSHRNMFVAHQRALLDYVPTPITADIHLVRASQKPFRQALVLRQLGPMYGWPDLTRGTVQQSLLQGWHNSVFYGERAAAFADAVARVIEDHTSG